MLQRYLTHLEITSPCLQPGTFAAEATHQLTRSYKKGQRCRDSVAAYGLASVRTFHMDAI